MRVEFFEVLVFSFLNGIARTHIAEYSFYTTSSLYALARENSATLLLLLLSMTTTFLKNTFIYFTLLLLLRAQQAGESVRRDVDVAHPAHSLLAVFLFLQQFFLARDVSAVALGENIFAHRGDGFSSDDFTRERGLHGDFEHLSR